MGPASSESPERLREFFQQFPDLKEEDFAHLLGMMAKSHLQPSSENNEEEKESPKPWNVGNFVDISKEIYPNLSWPQVIMKLDHPGFLLYDPRGLVLIMSIYKRATQVSDQLS